MIRFCKNCNYIMVGVTSFNNGTYERFYHCRKCKSETKRRNINNKEFEDLLQQELRK